MSLIVAMKSDKAIILGADSRGTIGDPRGLTAINDTHVKIFPLGLCGLGIAGASEMGAALIDEFKKAGIDKLLERVENKGKEKGTKVPYDVDFVMNKIFEQASASFSRWFKDIAMDNRPGVLLTLAGYRYPTGGNPEPMIFMLNSNANFAPQLFGHLPCMSGVPQYAVYLAHRYYDPGISTAKAKALLEYLITETASQDPKVGGRVRIAEITPEEGYRELGEDEIKEISDANAELNAKLREFFLKGEVQ